MRHPQDGSETERWYLRGYEQAVIDLGREKAYTEQLREFLILKSKRSSYGWSPGPNYSRLDAEQEGEIRCALEALEIKKPGQV